jgi:hypothetical protein
VTWRGRGALGLLAVERTKVQPEQTYTRVNRAGVRWATLTRSGTVTGGAPSRPWGADFFVAREKTTREPPA